MNTHLLISGGFLGGYMQNHVLDYLDRIVGKCPDKTAFANEKEELSFQRVYEDTRAIGTFLHKAGCKNEPVLVFMNKHPKTIVAFFGVIEGGCYYVPIDEQMPAARIRLIMDNVKARYMICDAATAKKAQQFVQDEQIVLYDDIVKTPADDKALEWIRAQAIDTDPIYIVFTSGSTGVPKGVAACHRSVIDYIEQLSDVLEFDENTVFGNQTPLYFDACLKELYPTLKFGATTYLIPKGLFSFPVRLVEFMNEKRINTICWVVSALTMISGFGTFDTVIPKYLRCIAFGSEVFPVKQFNLWKEVLPEAKFTNLYGPTEGTGMCCYYKAERKFQEGESIPIGRPFKNTRILLLDESGKEANPGEICIQGTSVTLGYYNNPEKTKEAFVQNPLQSFYPEIIYKTGDIARRDEDGNLVFVSRKDYQIKHMGHRIELGEIEASVNTLDGIKICACVYDKPNEKIVLFYVGEAEAKDIISGLKDKLPRYMFPNEMIKLDKMLFTANGKIDRKALLNTLSSN